AATGSIAISPARGTTHCTGTWWREGNARHRPSLAPIPGPYSPYGENSRQGWRSEETRTRSGETFQEGPGQADARQGGAAGAIADRASARRPAQSGDRPRRGRPGLADRAQAAARQV